MLRSNGVERALLRNVLNSIQDVVGSVDALRVESTLEHTEISKTLDTILRVLDRKSMTSSEQEQVLRHYANTILKSRHQRISTAGVIAASGRVEDQICEPVLEDVFVEPNLTGAGSLRELRDEVDRLYETCRDDETDSLSKDDARRKLLYLESETWKKIQEGGGARPASEALAGKHVVVLLGDPGSGKTTLLRWLLIERAKEVLREPKGPVPLFVSVGDYARAWEHENTTGGDLRLDSYLVQRAESECGGLGEIVNDALLKDGRGVLLLLDGLDEVSRRLRRAVVPRLQEFLQAYVIEEQPTRIVISSRFFGYEEAPLTAPAVQLVVAPFTDDQIRNFALKWHQ